jgi:hypothetical protein
MKAFNFIPGLIASFSGFPNEGTYDWPESKIRVESVSVYDEGSFCVNGFSLKTKQACFTGINFNQDGKPFYFSWREQKEYPLKLDSLTTSAKTDQFDLFGGAV